MERPLLFPAYGVKWGKNAMRRSKERGIGGNGSRRQRKEGKEVMEGRKSKGGTQRKKKIRVWGPERGRGAEGEGKRRSIDILHRKKGRTPLNGDASRKKRKGREIGASFDMFSGRGRGKGTTNGEQKKERREKELTVTF